MNQNFNIDILHKNLVSYNVIIKNTLNINCNTLENRYGIKINLEFSFRNK